MRLIFSEIKELADKIQNANTLIMSQNTYNENIEELKSDNYKNFKIEIAENAIDGNIWICNFPNPKESYTINLHNILKE